MNLKNFLWQKLLESISIFHFSLKNINLGAHFLLLQFFITLIFKSLYSLKWYPIFDTFPLTQFSKFNNFLGVRCFFRQKYLKFCTPDWKLHNPYCYTESCVAQSVPSTYFTKTPFCRQHLSYNNNSDAIYYTKDLYQETWKFFFLTYIQLCVLKSKVLSDGSIWFKDIHFNFIFMILREKYLKC